MNVIHPPDQPEGAPVTRSGLHFEQLRGPNGWSAVALVDYGPPHHVTQPYLVQLIDDDTVRVLRDELVRIRIAKEA